MTIDYRLLATSVLGGVIFTFLANAASSKVLSLLENVGAITQWLKKVGDNIPSLWCISMDIVFYRNQSIKMVRGLAMDVGMVL